MLAAKESKTDRLPPLAAMIPTSVRAHQNPSVRKSGKCMVVLLALLTLIAGSQAQGVSYEPSSITPPKIPREFRGAWIATVANIDWPSKPGLATAEQKAELLSMLDRAAQLKLNAVIFQVRPACDAMYASKLEPWSEYLTGTMGKAPSPYYDPLAFAITEAHKRGLELHAWFNPYRALHFSSKSAIATNHLSNVKPGLVKRYGRFLWLDPGEEDVQDHILNVVLDVVRRYDIDGIHFDDYFYPDPVRGEDGRNVSFPDDASWMKSGAKTGLSRDDWRRQNVNRLIERAYKSIKAAKPWAKFGVSPHGIWRPKHPPQIQGGDNYALIYADSKLWLANGWVDYFSPQLYWPIAKKEQSFTALLDWWNDQNPKQRHIWPGLYTYKVLEEWKPAEILDQIRITRKQPVSAGQIHYQMKALMSSTELRASLSGGPYAEAALVPASPWLATNTPAKPKLSVTPGGMASVKLAWESNGLEKAARWVLQYQRDGKWKTQLLPGDQSMLILDGPLPDTLALSEVNRVGTQSPAATLSLQKQP